MLRSRLFHAIVVAGAAAGVISACSESSNGPVSSVAARHDGGAATDASAPSESPSGTSSDGAGPLDAASEPQDAAEQDSGDHDAGHTPMHDASLDDEDGGWPPTK